MKYLAFAVILLGAVTALPRTRRDSSPDFYELPSNASLLLGNNILTGFSCADLPYGYYADESNNCQIFHICMPYIDNDTYFVRQFSFVCGEGTVFDQERLICDFPETAIACSDSSRYRNSNEYFGRTEVNFLE